MRKLADHPFLFFFCFGVVVFFSVIASGANNNTAWKRWEEKLSVLNSRCLDVGEQ